MLINIYLLIFIAILRPIHFHFPFFIAFLFELFMKLISCHILENLQSSEKKDKSSQPLSPTTLGKERVSGKVLEAFIGCSKHQARRWFQYCQSAQHMSNQRFHACSCFNEYLLPLLIYKVAVELCFFQNLLCIYTLQREIGETDISDSRKSPFVYLDSLICGTV